MGWMIFLILCAYSVYLITRIGRGMSGKSSEFKQTEPDKHMDPFEQENIQETVIDPVCGMYITPESAIQQKIHGKVYYFCSETCQMNFVRKSA